MKTLKYLLSSFLILTLFLGCSDDEDNFDYLNTLVAPTDVSALFQITPDIQDR